MQNIKGKIVAKPEAGAKNGLSPRVPIIGETEVNYICGKCRTMLIKGFNPARYKNTVIQCMNCGEFNEV